MTQRLAIIICYYLEFIGQRGSLSASVGFVNVTLDKNSRHENLTNDVPFQQRGSAFHRNFYTVHHLSPQIDNEPY